MTCFWINKHSFCNLQYVDFQEQPFRIAKGLLSEANSYPFALQ